MHFYRVYLNYYTIALEISSPTFSSKSFIEKRESSSGNENENKDCTTVKLSDIFHT